MSPPRQPHPDTPPTVAPADPAARTAWQRLGRWRTFAALQHRGFRLLWAGHATTSMATWMDQVARGWLMYELTNSPVQLGLVHGVQAVPILLLSPVAGSVADRYPRQRQVILAQTLSAVVYAAMTLLILSGLIRPWHMYVASFLLAIAQTFQQPARAAMIADVVPSAQLTNAIGLNSILFNLARSTGPALAGVLIASLGTASCYAVQTLCYLASVAWTVPLRAFAPVRRRAAASAEAGGSLAQSIVEGWAFSWRNETVRAGLLITFCASVFLMPFTTLLPVFARDLLGVGATGQGGLLTAMGLGALCSAFLISSLGDQLPRGWLMLGGVTLYGLSVIAFAASHSFHLSLGLMSIVGLAHVSSYALVQTVIQTYAPAAFRGRTMAIFHQGTVVLTLGSALLGALASCLGAPWAVTVMALLGTLGIVSIGLALPQVRRIR